MTSLCLLAQGNAGAAGGAIICFLFAILIGAFIGLAIGAVILRAACSIYNSLFGASNPAAQVPNPSFGHAILIVLVTFIAYIVVQLVFGFILGAAGVIQIDPESMQQGGNLILTAIALPVNFLIASGVIAGMLPTTFPRAMLVALFEFLIWIAINVIIVIIVLVIGLGMGGLAG